MQRPPRDPVEPLLSGQLLWRLLFVGLLLSGASLGLFLYAQQLGLPLDVARTLAVNALVAGEIGYLFCARRLHGAANFSVRDNPMVWAMIALVILLQLAFSHWAPLQTLFGTAALDATGWALVAACGLAVMLLVELEKWLMRRLQPHRPPRAVGTEQPRSH
jgi:magnesium-transporting ATPase (P-type)